MLPAERRQTIISRLQTAGAMTNDQLAQELAVSLYTIRRDMRILAASGLLTRTHGGAVWTDEREVALKMSNDPLLSAKRAIVQKALDYIRPGETIALDVGTTNMQLAKALASSVGIKPATVITNDLGSAAILAQAKGMTVNVVGGTISEFSYLWGPLSKRMLEVLYFDTLFLATSGLTLDAGLTDPYPEAAEIKQMYIRNAQRTILLVDHTKFGLRHMVHVAPLEHVDVIITDRQAPTDFMATLAERGITCVQV